MKKALFLLLAMLAMGAPAFAQRQSANLSTAASACLTVPNATGYLAVQVNTTNGSGAISLSGTWSGTISFFASGDGGDTWGALSATPSDGTSAVTTATGNGVWQVNIAGYTHVCAAFTTASSGTAVTTINLGQASARSGGSGGGGGGGSPASPDQSFQINNMGAFGSGAFLYEASGNAVCQRDPSIYSIHMGEGTVCIAPDQISIINMDDDGRQAILNDQDVSVGATSGTSLCSMHDNSIVCTNANGNVNYSVDTVTAAMVLGFNDGTPGSLTLNGATSGSGTLGITDDGAYFTIPNSLVVGTTTFDPPVFPFTSVEPGEIFENDSAGNETVDLLNDGTLILGNATGMEGGAITVLGLASMSGTRFVCVGTDGTFVSSATACVGT